MLKINKSLSQWFALLCCLVYVLPLHAQTVEDLLLLQARVNQVKKNDVRVWVEADNKIWIHQADFDKLKLSLDKIERKSINGEFYVLLNADGIQSQVDMNTLELVIQAQPKLLGTQIIDLGASKNKPLTAQPWLTALTNYDWSLNYAKGEPQTWNGSTFSSLALGPVVLQNTHSFSSTNGFSQKREVSHLHIDWPSAKIRFAAGDIFPTGGAFSRAGPMFGVQVSRRFELQPEYSPNPSFQYLGSVDSPSTAELSVDGQLIRSFKVTPGLIDLRNFSYFAGLRNLSLTLTDAYGVKKTIDLPFYFTEQNLHQGVHEFNYSIGRMRQSNANPYAPWQYKDLGWSVSHRVGLTSFLTLGAYAEKVPEHKLWGARLSLVLGRFGTLAAEGAWRQNLNDQHDVMQKGRALQLAYQINRGGFSFNTAYLKQTDGFEGINYQSDGTVVASLRDSLNIGLSAAIGSKQTVSANFSRQHDTMNNTSIFASLVHRWAVNSRLNLQSYVTQKRANNQKSLAFGIQLAYQMSDDWSSNTYYQNDDGDRRVGVQAQYSPNQGQTVSARISAEQSTTDTSQSQWLDAAALYRTRYANIGLHARQYQSKQQNKTSANLDISGGLAYLGGRIYASRPIGQAFAVVDAAEQAQVRVYQNNQLLGRTNRKGRLLVPNLTAYLGQQVRIDDRDIPLEIGLDQVQKYATPRDGAGVLLKFTGQTTAAVSAILMADFQGQKVPMNNAFLSISADDFEQKTSTGPDGDFYIDGIKTDVVYRLHASNKTLQCDATFSLPKRDNALIDLGTLMCEKVTPYE